LSTITQGENGFMPPRQYCGGVATGMELRMRGGYIGRAATGLERRNKQ
jgi:lactoylglutathione lyase